jgi:photosystem II stability/assembly factor-like uncharacterized protein
MRSRRWKVPVVALAGLAATAAAQTAPASAAQTAPASAAPPAATAPTATATATAGTAFPALASPQAFRQPSWRDVSPAAARDRQFRGLAAVSSRVAWLAGTAGTVLRTVDGGRSWADVSPRGLPAGIQFRDVEALDARRAVALTIGTGTDSRIYRTVDGGATWTLGFVNRDPAAFYDCMAFFSPLEGIAVADPPDGKFRIVRTTDGGRHWAVQSSAGMPAALPGEFAFAASGTCLVTSGRREASIASGGGATSRVYHSTDAGHTWSVSATPVASGAAAGIFSLAVRPFSLAVRPFSGQVPDASVTSGTAVVAVGGDFTAPTGRGRIAAVSIDSRRWLSSPGMPHGYRSGVAFLPGTVASLVAVGPTGSDVSTNAGLTWTSFDTGSFDTVQCAADGACWASGAGGRVGLLSR